MEASVDASVEADKRSLLKNVLSIISDTYRFREDTWRTSAYAKGATAVASVIRMPDLDRPEQATGVGKSIGDTIRRIHGTLRAPIAGTDARSSSSSSRSGRQREMDKDKKAMDVAMRLGFLTRDDVSLVRSYRKFLGIMGVGEKKARELVRDGYRSLKDVSTDRRRLDLNSPLHAVGLDHYEDLTSRMPLDEATRLADMITRVIRVCRAEGVEENSTTPLGSLRRKCPTVGDVDVLILACDDEGFRSLGRRIPRVLKDDLILVLRSGNRRHSFVVVHEGRARQVDVFRATDRSEWAAFVLYGTGSATFNERMRARARSKGLLLNEYGLYKNGKNTTSNKDGKDRVRIRVPLTTEADIFEALGMKYVSPQRRI